MKFSVLVQKILSKTEIMKSIKGHIFVTNMRKMVRYNPNLGLYLSILMQIQNGNFLLICSKDIERKLNFEGQNDRRMDRMMDGQILRQAKSSIAPLFQSVDKIR